MLAIIHCSGWTGWLVAPTDQPQVNVELCNHATCSRKGEASCRRVRYHPYNRFHRYPASEIDLVVLE